MQQDDEAFSVHGTGLCLVQARHPNVIALRGKPEVTAMKSAEQGPLFTLVFCSSAAAPTSTPAKTGSFVCCHSSGCMQSEIDRR